ncbi:hypothetical protein GCM10010104_21790 [Streptomyces indiaensis]|uniref:Uncharacterized protein n=1 Tax=Streptomyces indiaensis TaxID=284033 RepID=A0ABP5Q895_9ACTN
MIVRDSENLVRLRGVGAGPRGFRRALPPRREHTGVRGLVAHDAGWMERTSTPLIAWGMRLEGTELHFCG